MQSIMIVFVGDELWKQGQHKDSSDVSFGKDAIGGFVWGRGWGMEQVCEDVRIEGVASWGGVVCEAGKRVSRLGVEEEEIGFRLIIPKKWPLG